MGAWALWTRLSFGPALRSLRRSGWGERGRLAAFAAGFLFFESLLYRLFLPMLQFLFSIEGLGDLLVSRVLTLFFTFLMFFLGLSSLLALLSRLFLATETVQLAALPVDPAAYFRFRSLQAFASAAGMFLPLWLPLPMPCARPWNRAGPGRRGLAWRPCP